MNPRQTVESYWSVWVFNGLLGEGTWEPYAEGLTTKRVAQKHMREEQARYPDERFAIVRTVNTRVKEGR